MKSLFLIDANSLIHRAYHALPPFTGPQGQPTGALYGLSNLLLKILREDQPDYVAAFFDRPEPTFRKKIFNDYKIHRPKAEDNLVAQIIAAHDVFENFGIRTYEIPSFEADDLIATAAEKFKSEKELLITIFTGDLDALQLVEDDKILVRALKKGVSETMTYNELAVKERYGVTAEEMPEYKSLVGDPSDNIPGVPGIGPKTASALIQKYGSLENFFTKGQEEKLYEKLSSQKDQIVLSKKLVTAERNSPLEINNLQELKCLGVDREKLIPFFGKLGFKSLAERLNGNQKEKAAPKAPPKTLF